MNPHRARRFLPYTLFVWGLSTLRLVVAGSVSWWHVVLWTLCLLAVVYLYRRRPGRGPEWLGEYEVGTRRRLV